MLVGFVLLASLATPARAQSLPALLPDDVEVAIGLIDLNGVTDRIEPFLAEAERVGLVDAIVGALPGVTGTSTDDVGALLPSAFDGLGPLDLLGTEAWIAVSASPFDPLPAATLLARVSPAARDAFALAIADAAGRDGTRTLEEAGRTFYTYVPEGGMLPDPERPNADVGLPLAYAQIDDVVVLSTDPEVVRFVLRAADGSGAATFADLPAWRELTDLGPGQVLGYLDPQPLTRSLEPLAASSGAGELLARVQEALATAGPSVGVLRLDDEGLVSVGRQTPDPTGPDALLYDLLTRGSAPSLELLRFAPAGAPTVAAGAVDLQGWWRWLDDVLASAAGLGLPTATEALALLELDADRLLLSWAGDGWGQIQTAPLTATDPAMADATLLGEQVLVLRSRDDEAARAGLEEAWTLAGATLAGFLAPSGDGTAAPVSVEIAGVKVIRLTLSDTLTLDAAVVDGWVVLSGSSTATEAVLGAYAENGDGPAALTTLAADLPADLRSWSLSAPAAGDTGSADALIGQLQMLAGLGGASTLDFEAVDRASEAVAAYAAYLAERIGPSIAWTRLEDGVLLSRQRIHLSW